MARELPENVILSILDDEFAITLVNDGEYEFRKNTPSGICFTFAMDIGNNIREFAEMIWQYFESFDVSKEAYKWLDSTGHGKNGAPYEMIDVYNDMMECKFIINDLYHIVRRFVV